MNSGAYPEFMESKGIEVFAPGRSKLQSKVTRLISELFKGDGQNGNTELTEVINAVYDNVPYQQKTVCLARTEILLTFSLLPCKAQTKFT